MTGLAMGGRGTRDLLARFEDRFAAAVPICAVSPNSSFAPGVMNDMPLWAFHARDDRVVPSTSTRNVVAGILAAAGEPLPNYPVQLTGDFSYLSPTLDLRHTEYRTGGHGIWGRVYNTPKVYEWMFSHSLVPEPASAMIASIGVVLCLGGTRRRRPPA